MLSMKIAYLNEFGYDASINGNRYYPSKTTNTKISVTSALPRLPGHTFIYSCATSILINHRYDTNCHPSLSVIRSKPPAP